MTPLQIGNLARAIRIRQGLRQVDLGRIAGVSRWAISLLERGELRMLSYGVIESIFHTLGARLDARVLWNGPDVDRLLDAGHAAVQAAVKRQLERLGWVVRVEVSFSRYGERGRIDLLAFHPTSRVLLVIEVKTLLVDAEALLGSVDVKARLALHVAATYGWEPRAVIPTIVFAEEKTTRRRLSSVDTLFDRYSFRGRACLTWLRRQRDATDGSPAPPTGLLWFTSRGGAGERQVGRAGECVQGARAPSSSGRLLAPAAYDQSSRRCGSDDCARRH